MLLFADAAVGPGVPAAKPADRLYAVPITQVSVRARRSTTAGAVDDFIESTTGRVTRGSVTGGNNRMAGFPTIQIKLAEAAASIDAARTILLRDLEVIACEMRETGEGSRQQGSPTAADRCRQSRSRRQLLAAMGGNGLALSNPVQRAWRDVNAIGRHVSLNWDAVAAM